MLKRIAALGLCLLTLPAFGQSSSSINSFIISSAACDDSNPSLTYAVDLQAGVGLWQNSAKTTPADDAGEAVYVWADQSGNGRDYRQPIAANQPAILDNELNGYDAVDFDGSDWLSFRGAQWFTNAEHEAGNPMTAFVVMKVDNIASTRFVYTVADSGATNAYIDGHVDSATGDARAVDRTDGTANIAESNNQVGTSSYVWLFYKFNGLSDRRVLLQGDTEVQNTTTNGTGVDWNHACIGARCSSAFDNGLDGKVVEVKLFESLITGANETTLTDYAECKFGI